MSNLTQENEMLICPKCNWVHFSVSYDYVKNWEKEWLHYFKTWDKETLARNGITDKPPTMKDSYLNCFNCGNSYENMVSCTDDEVPSGSTIQPILHPRHSLEGLFSKE